MAQKTITDLIEKTTLTANDFLVVDDGTNTNKVAHNKKQDSTDNSLQTTDKTVVGAINEVNSLARGKSQARDYPNYSAMVTAVNAMSATEMLKGDNIYILTVSVPDLWVKLVDSTSVPYTYTNDAAIVSALKTTGYIQCGYYQLAMLEAEKVDITSKVDKVTTANQLYGTDANGAQTTYNVSSYATTTYVSQQVTPVSTELTNYTTLNVPTTGWTQTTLASESCYTNTLVLSGATTGKHPLVSCIPTKPSTMDAENIAFGLLISVQEGNNSLTLISKTVPETAYTLQVKNY